MAGLLAAKRRLVAPPDPHDTTSPELCRGFLASSPVCMLIQPSLDVNTLPDIIIDNFNENNFDYFANEYMIKSNCPSFLLTRVASPFSEGAQPTHHSHPRRSGANGTLVQRGTTLCKIQDGRKND
jgi:hypothetical protein